MGQHHLVHVDVAMIGWQLFGVQIGNGDLRQEAQDSDAEASNVTQEDGAR